MLAFLGQRVCLHLRLSAAVCVCVPHYAFTSISGDGLMDIVAARNQRISVYINPGLCDVGSVGPLGSPPCQTCAAGQYSDAIGRGTCLQCPGGRYGVVAGQASAAAACNGTCAAGYACAPGSATPTASVCPQGSFSLEGAAVCSLCPAGRYGASQALPAALCSGPCAAGYVCAIGSTSDAALECPPGSFSLEGEAVCSLCQAGRYGASQAVPSAACTGACEAGYACPAGSTNGTVELCSAGKYSTVGSGACTACPTGVYGAAPGLTNASCSGPCLAGRYGDATGLTSPLCSGVCAAGYYCPAGSTSPAMLPCAKGTYSTGGAASCLLCPSGLFGASPGLQSPACTGMCTAGYSCPAGSTASTANICPVRARPRCCCANDE
jgi:hypothetical protein